MNSFGTRWRNSSLVFLRDSTACSFVPYSYHGRRFLRYDCCLAIHSASSTAIQEAAASTSSWDQSGWTCPIWDYSFCSRYGAPTSVSIYSWTSNRWHSSNYSIWPTISISDKHLEPILWNYRRLWTEWATSPCRKILSRNFGFPESISSEKWTDIFVFHHWFSKCWIFWHFWVIWQLILVQPQSMNHTLSAAFTSSSFLPLTPGRTWCMHWSLSISPSKSIWSDLSSFQIAHGSLESIAHHKPCPDSLLTAEISTLLATSGSSIPGAASYISCIQAKTRFQ